MSAMNELGQRELRTTPTEQRTWHFKPLRRYRHLRAAAARMAAQESSSDFDGRPGYADVLPRSPYPPRAAACSHRLPPLPPVAAGFPVQDLLAAAAHSAYYRPVPQTWSSGTRLPSHGRCPTVLGCAHPPRLRGRPSPVSISYSQHSNPLPMLEVSNRDTYISRKGNR